MTRFGATLMVSTLAILCPLSTSMAVSQPRLAASPHSFLPSRRQACLSFLSLAWASRALPAGAVQERNEALCSTGFFENIGQWYCTPIGNIADEGKSGSLSSNQDGVADSLMSKLMLDVNANDREIVEKGSSAGGSVEQPAAGDPK